MTRLRIVLRDDAIDIGDGEDKELVHAVRRGAIGTIRFVPSSFLRLLRQ